MKLTASPIVTVVFGTTNNPWDLSRTPGGSTGGGAAALAAGLTYISVGSDVGGSIRIPAHFCGVFGHKSSQTVVPYEGNILPAAKTLWVGGLLARSAQDLKTGLEILKITAKAANKWRFL